MCLNPLSRYITYQLYHAGILLGAAAREGKEEQIHQFRVALRRSRSLVKLYLDTSVPFPKELKSAVKATNAIRELDVLIASINPSKYPETLKTLQQMRGEYFDDHVTDDFRRSTLESLRRYEDLLCGADPDIPEQELVERVEAHFSSSLDAYRSISDKTTQKELHTLRVDFKNARYGFEFLRDEGIAEEAEKIGECKNLQNILGEVQDGYNQIEWLEMLYKRRPCGETKKLLKKRKKGLEKLRAASRSVLSRAARDTRSSG